MYIYKLAHESHHLTFVNKSKKTFTFPALFLSNTETEPEPLSQNCIAMATWLHYCAAQLPFDLLGAVSNLA